MLSTGKERLTGVTGTREGNRPGKPQLKYLTGVFNAISLAETYRNTFIRAFLDPGTGSP